MAYTFDTKADFDALYLINAEWNGYPSTRQPIRLHYNRAVLYQAMGIRAQALIDTLGLLPAHKVLLVGCGFGWTIEHLIAKGITDTWGTETSAWIQSVKAGSERADIEAAVAAVGLDPYTGEGLAKVEEIGGRFGFTRSLVPTRILNEDGQKQASRSRIGQAIGGVPTWIIIEDIAPALDDAGNIAFVGNIKQIGNVNLAHLCTPLTPNGNQDPQLHWKSIEDWSTLFGGDTVIEAGTWRRVN